MKPIGNDFSFGVLRSLQLNDADGMLEWMRDPDIAGRFRIDFESFDRQDVESFIKASWSNSYSAHFAIDDGRGEYLGTVSLKDINDVDSSAEYAISTRACAHGKGVAAKATKDLLKVAFGPLGLHRVFLNVRADNGRAISFYEKTGFVREGVSRDALAISEGQFVDLVWYSMLENEMR